MICFILVVYITNTDLTIATLSPEVCKIKKLIIDLVTNDNCCSNSQQVCSFSSVHQMIEAVYIL